MQEEALKKVLDSLLEIKATMHDAADVGVVQKLDEAIELVRRGIESEEPAEVAVKALTSIGKLLDALPSIVELLKMLTG